MKTLLIALAVAFAAAAPVVASAESGAMRTVHQFIDGFNKGNLKMATAACAKEVSITDEFAPYEWHGAGAFTRWCNA